MEPEITSPVTSMPEVPNASAPRTPAQLSKQKQASWGAIIVIVLILAMIVIGALYAWGQRIAEAKPPAAAATTN
jgi:uncharacterized protein HemX